MALPIGIDTTAIEIASDFIGKAEGASQAEIETFEDCCLIISEMIVFGCREVLCLNKRNTYDFSLSDDAHRAAFQKFLDALTASSKKETESVFQFLLANAVGTFLQAKGFQSNRRSLALAQSLKYLIKALKTLIRRNALYKVAHIKNKNPDFLPSITQFAARTIVELPFRDTCSTHFEVTYLINIVLLGTKYDFCREKYDHQKFYEKFIASVLELQDTSVSAIHHSPISYPHNRTALKIIWGLYNFAELIYCCIDTLSSSYRKQLQTKIMETQPLEKLFGLKAYAKSELAYSAGRFLIWLWFQNIKFERTSNSKFLEEKKNDSEFCKVVASLPDFYQQPWENFWELSVVLAPLKENEHFCQEYVLKGKLLSAMTTSLFNGESLFLFKPSTLNVARFYDSFSSQTMNFKGDVLPKIVFSTEKSLLDLTQKLYDEISQKSQDIPQLELYRKLLRLRSLELSYDVLENLRERCHIAVEERYERMIEWLAHPCSVLFVNSKYWKGSSKLNLDPKTALLLTKNYEKHMATFVRIQVETASLNIKEAEIMNGAKLIQLVSHYNTKKQFNSLYFDGVFTNASLKYCHYLQFIFTHALPDDPYICVFTEHQKQSLQLVNKLLEAQNISLSEFLLGAVKIFLQIVDNYFDALLEEKNAKTDPHKEFKSIADSHFSSRFFSDYSNRLWNLLNLAFFTEGKKSFEAWDGLPLLELLHPIGLEDLSDEYTLSKKTFRNIVLTRFFNTNLTRNGSQGKNQLHFVIRMMQRVESLTSLFNWKVALDSNLKLFKEIDSAEKTALIATLKKFLDTPFKVKEVILEAFPTKEENQFSTERYQMCQGAFDAFIKNINEIVSKSVLLFSDVYPIGGIFLTMLQKLFLDVNSK